jgi:hypothetical protein
MNIYVFVSETSSGFQLKESNSRGVLKNGISEVRCWKRCTYSNPKLGDIHHLMKLRVENEDRRQDCRSGLCALRQPSEIGKSSNLASVVSSISESITYTGGPAVQGYDTRNGTSDKTIHDTIIPLQFTPL